MYLTGKFHSARRALVALSFALVGFTTGAHAQSIIQVDQALADLYPAKTGFETPAVVATSSNTVVTATQLQAAIQLIASGTGATVAAAGHGSANGFGLPQDVAKDIALVSGQFGEQSADTIQADMIAGYITATAGSPSLLEEYLPAVTGSAAAYGNFTPSTADASESTIVGKAITAAPAQLAAILEAALADTDPNPVEQAALLVAKATSTNLGNAIPVLTLGQLATDIAGTTDIGGGVLTSANTGTFLEGVLKADTTAVEQQGFLEGYVAGSGTAQSTVSALATTATNIILAAPSTFAAASRINVLIGLVTSGTTNGYSTAAVLPGVVTGILSGQTYGVSATANDTAITSLVDGVTGMISTYPSQANLIAEYAAKTLQDPTADAFAFTNGVLGNTNVKSTAGTNGIVDITQAISDDFTLTNVTATGGNIEAKEGAVEAGIKALSSAQVLSGSAAELVSQAVAQVLLTSTTSQALITFADNFISAVDTKNSNDPAITTNDRAYAAIGLATAYDTAGIAGASVSIAAAAVATYDSSVTDINDVAQPILQTFSGVSGTETGAMAAAISQIGGSYTVGTATADFTPAYLAAQLILASKSGVPAVVNYNLVDDIALGADASSAVLDGTFGSSSSANYSGNKDTFLSALAANLDTSIALPFLNNIALYLAGASGYSDTEIVKDFAIGLTTVSATVSAESGTLAAVVAKANTADAAGIAHAAAANVSLDSVRYTIAEDVVKNVAGSAIAVSGSVADTIAGAGGTYTQGYDLAILVHDLVGLDGVVSDDSAIALNAANALPSTDNDTDGLEYDLANIVKNAVPATNGTFNKTAANVELVADNIAINYNASLSGTVGSLGGYTNVALFAKDVLADFPAVTAVSGAADLSDDLANALVPQMITANSDNVATAALIAGQFTAALPNSSLAIATDALASSQYTNFTPDESGTIGAAIVANLPTTLAFASKVPVLSGDISVIAAVAGSGTGVNLTQASINASAQDVAGVFASYTSVSGSVPAAAYTTVAENLGAYVFATGGTNNALHTLTIPSIFEAFASPTTLGSSATSAEVWLTKLIKYGTAGDLGDIYNAADIYGVAIYADPTLASFESALETSIASDIGATASAAGWQALISLGGAFAGDNGSTTLATLKTQLNGLLNEAQLRALNDGNYNANGTGGYGNINSTETPVVNM